MAETVNETRATVIAKAVGTAFTGLGPVDAAATEARNAAIVAGGKRWDKRQVLLTALAATAIKGKWNTPDITAGVKAAVAAAPEANRKTLATFASEVARACHPGVRDHVQTIFAVTVRLWDEEKAALADDGDADCPISTAWSSKYRFAQALFSAAKGTEKVKARVLTDEEDILDYARECDPAKDAKRIAARIAKMRETLAEFGAEFPHPMFPEIDKCLAKLDPAALRGGKSASVTPPVAPVVQKVGNVAKAKAAAVTPASEPVDGASEIDLIEAAVASINAIAA